MRMEDSYRFESISQKLHLPPHLASVEEGRMGGTELWDSSTGEDISGRNEDDFYLQFADAKAGYYIVYDGKGNHRLVSNSNLVIKKRARCRETDKIFYISIYDAAAERKEYEENYKEFKN